MKKKLCIFFVLLSNTFLWAQESIAQNKGLRKPNVANEIVYSKAWEVGFHLRTDGWQLGADIAKSRNYFKSNFYSIDIGEYKHPKQVRQSKDPYSGGFINTSGLKPFIYGKQNSLYTIHGYIGQKFLLAEKAKRHGVMLNYYYQGGLAIGVLKPYVLQIWTDPREDIFVDVAYDKNTENKFLDPNYIRGSAGFGKGWKLKIRPGLSVKTGLQFDWSNQDNFIKALDFGLSADFYFAKMPMMVTEENKVIFINAFVGFSLGKKS